MEVDDGIVVLRLEGVGVEVCDDGHVTVVDDGLADHLVASLRGQLLVAGRRRLLRRDTCGNCGEDLALPPRTTETPVVDDDGPTVVTLVPVAPMVRCSACGREQYVAAVADRLEALVPRAVTAVAAGMPGPSGTSG
ncbi:hypothetical protein [Salsipaludibacter albus]|uniref:hypothetical protein n=1 Tax=Salsipaludibacter albus TaxID=2849650 RepID=UPI001EE49724|nr:hypothetical protein [Salsipaludibacter albus]MBY5163181.1 hypothetical protein [Salsipaludibacter albus]